MIVYQLVKCLLTYVGNDAMFMKFLSESTNVEKESDKVTTFSHIVFIYHRHY